MKIDLSGKYALVGGSSKGIGKAIAERLAASGASVTLMARSEELLKSIVTQINNTQGPAAGGAIEKSIKDYQTAFDLLFKCAVHTTTLALKHMKSQQWGRIVNVASVSVKEPLNYLALSNSLRAALVTWAKSLSMDIAADNITINNTLTGYFDTERIAQLNAQKAKKMNVSPEKVREAMEAQVPMQRIGQPEEYANLVCFLASQQASYITGTNIPIDGGLLKSF